MLSMTRLLASAAGLLAASTVLAQTITKETAAGSPPARAGLVIHEWGTFTSFSGPDGVVRKVAVRIGEDLPAFVLGRTAGEIWHPNPADLFGKDQLMALQRMETPVIYFYTDKPVEATVDVSLPKGLITEVYPPVSSSASLVSPGQTSKGDFVGGSIRWSGVKVTPKYCCDVMTFPDAGTSHYSQARKTESDVISIAKDGANLGEKFLFYRGVADADFGVKARAFGGDRFGIERSERGVLAAAFIVEVEGGKVRFAVASDVKAGGELRLPKEASTADGLGEAMAAALERAGLYKPEATAMVATWKHLWFGENGTRILAILPQATIDAAMPLSVTPTPTEQKRVFVARLEMLTPERLDWLADMVMKADKAVSGPEHDRIFQQIRSLGRFTEPAILIAREAIKGRA